MKVYQRMKIMKKWLAVLLTAVLTLAVVLPVYAVGGLDDGSITINNAVKDQTYSIYRIFDLESYNKDEGAYLYKVNNAWEGFINQASISGSEGYVAVDGNTGLVTWKKKDNNNNLIGVDEFAKQALAYAKDPANSITAVNSATSTTTGKNGVKVTKNNNADTYTIEFSGLKLGYYLVDSSLGTLCALNTTNPAVTMREKNGEPTVEKKVQEDGNFGERASAQIGDTVTFQTTIHAEKGAENYVLYDKMTKGLAFAGITNVVKNSGAVQTNITDTDYKLTTGNTGDDYSFKLEFSSDVCSGLSVGDTIVVTYTATLTKEADIGGTNPNTNEAWLKYGDNANTETTHVKTEVYTYQFQLVKTDEGKNGTYNVLTGAKFKLYAVKTGGTAIKFEKQADNTYIVVSVDTVVGGTVTDVIEAGTPVIKGLDAKTYWLEEIEAPDGFNKLTSRVAVDISAGDNLVIQGQLSNGAASQTYTPGANPSGVQVINKAGGMLPSTGGIGTTIFYVLGGILVLSAAVMLVIRYRRGEEK